MSPGTKRSDKIVNAIDLMIESLHKPDSELRASAIEHDCLESLFYIRGIIETKLKEERAKYN